ncbi:hypothetical protein OAF33_00745 [bacterium]|nr:hypothetical protein [bacterium]MDB4754141.1 hypothetical protein [Akkermansiaceae bacterium]
MSKTPQKSPVFLITTLLVTILIGFGAGAVLSIFSNPEVQFWTEYMEIKDEEIECLDSPKIVFAGGSSCTFSVNAPLISERTGLPAYNYGGSAFMGVRYMFERTKKHLKKGDILVVGYEPAILEGMDGTKSYPLGPKMCFSEGDLKMAEAIKTEMNGRKDWLEALRPGLRNSVVILGRKLSGRRPYTYSQDDFREGGRLELENVEYQVPLRDELNIVNLDGTAVEFLEEVALFCNEIGVMCVYTIPWQATKPPLVNDLRESRKSFMSRVSKIMPIILDPQFGVVLGYEGFSDSEYHLGPLLSEKRSEFLADYLKEFLEK